MKKIRTKEEKEKMLKAGEEKEKMLKAGEENNKLRWFCVVNDFKCGLITLKKDWYEKTGTGKTKNENWLHSIKSRTSKELFTISDVDYLKIIDTFKEKNKHLL